MSPCHLSPDKHYSVHCFYNWKSVTFLDATQKLKSHSIFLSACGWHSVMSSKSSHVVSNGRLSFLRLNESPVCVYATFSLASSLQPWGCACLSYCGWTWECTNPEAQISSPLGLWIQHSLLINVYHDSWFQNSDKPSLQQVSLHPISYPTIFFLIKSQALF